MATIIPSFINIELSVDGGQQFCSSQAKQCNLEANTGCILNTFLTVTRVSGCHFSNQSVCFTDATKLTVLHSSDKIAKTKFESFFFQLLEYVYFLENNIKCIRARNSDDIQSSNEVFRDLSFRASAEVKNMIKINSEHFVAIHKAHCRLGKNVSHDSSLTKKNIRNQF